MAAAGCRRHRRRWWRTISNLAFTELAYRTADRDLIRLWARAEEAGRRVVDGYRSIVDDPASNSEARVGGGPAGHRCGLSRRGAATPSLPRRRVPQAGRRSASDDCRPRWSTSARALVLQGDLVGSEAPLREASRWPRRRDEPVVLRAALGNLALGLRDRGETDEALALFARGGGVVPRSGRHQRAADQPRQPRPGLASARRWRRCARGDGRAGGAVPIHRRLGGCRPCTGRAGCGARRPGSTRHGACNGSPNIAACLASSAICAASPRARSARRTPCASSAGARRLRHWPRRRRNCCDASTTSRCCSACSTCVDAWRWRRDAGQTPSGWPTSRC